MRKIYLAGAVEVYKDSDKAREWRNNVKEYFSKYLLNFECISPVDYYNFDSNIAKNFFEIMRFDLRKVREADVILVNLNDIRKSIGTNDEILYAYLLGKPIIGFIDDDIEGEELANKIHTWKFSQIDRIETGENSMFRACEYVKDYYS